MRLPSNVTGAAGAFLVLFLVVAAYVPSASGAEPDAIEHPVPARIEVGPDFAEVDRLARLGINIDAVFDGWARVYVVAKERAKLYKLGFDVSLLPNDSPRKAEEARLTAETRDKRPPTQRGSVAAEYHTYTTLTQDLQQIATDHPDIVRLSSIGQTNQGRELWMVKISDNPDVQEDEPEFAYISSMHGDEVVGKEVLYNLIDYLTDNYGSLSRVTNIVDDTELWIMPSMNPDGTEIGQRGNANGKDLNRDFPDQFIDAVNTTVGRQAETAAIMNWRAGVATNMSINFHGGALVTNYPLDSNPQGTSSFSPAPPPDHAMFQSFARTYADNNPPMSVSNGHPAWDDGITNGADWYAINGGMQDWQYVWHGGFEVLVEISSTKWPGASSLPGFWDDNLESLLSCLERVHEGVRGLITDAETGLPLSASIQFDSNPFVAYTDREMGDYHRALMPDTYTLTIRADGRETLVIPNVVVNAGPATVVNAALGPAPVDLQPMNSAVLDGANGFVDVGETTDLSLTLLNLGRSATGVSGQLIPTGYDAEVSRSLASYPNIDVAGTGGSLAPHFEIQANPQIAEGRKLGFAVQWLTDQGVGMSDPFFLEIGSGTVDSVPSTDVPKNIGIFYAETAVSDLVIPIESSVTNVTDVKVTIDLTHSFIGDIEVAVQSPNGTLVQLHNHGGGSASDIVGTYGVDLTPTQSLDAFNGENSLGTWTLSILDTAIGDGGDLNGWSLQITGRPAETTTPEMKFKEISRNSVNTTLEWWPYPGITGYRVYRSSDPANVAAFVDVTGTDPNDTDTLFDDSGTDPLVFYLVTGMGPGGEGPKGHFGE
ncbi:MAG: M14 family zinc carboxypeptidase [Acidobacteriota bacterium]|nr:M14 family zinc carboxypeptidase [Acidobacteriota bacterium]